MRPLSSVRRSAIAACSLAVAAVLFHGSVASALVTRGDDLMRSGDVDGAVRAYERAIQLDRGSAIAADRLAFYLLLRRKAGDAAAAFAVADAALEAFPGNSALHADRALAAARLARWHLAERDFVFAARADRDPRFAHLAARMAWRAHLSGLERADLELAVSLDRDYAPARALLGSGGR
jgi:tetratricopeptide (TPR) repeat protein